ncbi:MAG: TIGR02281 family clan AA aspartic protease [Rickettsiaceae bacterium]|nr:TIGR02281 family clan AA aspartic protease [Rickettsiaceae bacterium]
MSTNNNQGGTTNLILWLLIFLSLIVVYAFRFELSHLKDRLLAVIVPSYAWTNDKGQLTIARSADGHFYINAQIGNNNKIKFLIDTGATDVALSKQAAIELGFNPDKLSYTKHYHTANGISAAAPVVIKQLTIGQKTFYNIAASVNQGQLDTSLLGMSVIDDFKSFQISNDLLILNY